MIHRHIYREGVLGRESREGRANHDCPYFYCPRAGEDKTENQLPRRLGFPFAATSGFWAAMSSGRTILIGWELGGGMGHLARLLPILADLRAGEWWRLRQACSWRAPSSGSS